MMTFRLQQARWLGAVGLGLLLAASGCSTLLPKAKPQPAFYALDGAQIDTQARAPDRAATGMAAPTLIVNPPHASAGFDSPRIIYVREPHKLNYFAHSDWIDTPARMLAPLIVAAVERGGAFRAVALTPSTAAGDLRLDTEIVRLQQDFSVPPSRVRFTLRATLVHSVTRQVLAQREFDTSVTSASDDTYGGVVAANQAVQIVLEQLSGFCTEAARRWQASPGNAPNNAAGSTPGR